MFEQALRFIAKVEDKTAHFILDNGTTIEQAEKMCLQMLQNLGILKIQQQQAQQQEEKKPEDKADVQS